MEQDNKYVDIFLEPILHSLNYKPKFGQGKTGLSFEDFQTLYQEDVFYSWLGLDSSLMYAAHRTSGGMTSIYRQIGTGSERLFRAILQDKLLLSEESVNWSFTISTQNGEITKYLDGRIEFADIQKLSVRKNLQNWVRESAKVLGVEHCIASCLRGIVFEVRQGYKSKDSKRQLADMDNATSAYTNAYLPCLFLFSHQIDTDVVRRYEQNRWIILTGKSLTNNKESSYAFMKECVGYDLADFFRRNSAYIKEKIENVLTYLLSTNNQ